MIVSADDSVLTPVELQLVEQVSRGESFNPVPGGLIDEAAMVDWGKSRTVRASVIRDILLGRLATGLDPRGVRLRGVRLADRLDLEGLSTNINLELDKCYLPMGLSVCDARLAVLRLNGCRLEHASDSAMAADRLVASLVVLTGATVIGSGAYGALRLLGARLHELDCNGAKLQNNSGPALRADGMQVEQAVFLRDGFEATGVGDAGAVGLFGARISRLECDGAKLHNSTGPALSAESIRVEQAMFLRAGKDWDYLHVVPARNEPGGAEE